MASKKDKLTQKIQEEVKKNVSSNEPQTTYSEVLKDIQFQKKEEQEQVLIKEQKENFNTIDEKIQDKKYGEKNKETMSKKRDSIYNVSADLRLEDYVEDNQKKEYGPIVRNILIFLLILLFIAGIWKLLVWIFTPNYYLSIANTEITEENYKDFLDNNVITLYPGQLLHIRFTYLKRKSDYYTIQILRVEGNSLSEEAVLGRKIPKTANYIYFAGPVDPGTYQVKVLDRQRELIIERKIEIISP
jgi:hypothetical protein